MLELVLFYVVQCLVHVYGLYIPVADTDIYGLYMIATYGALACAEPASWWP